jgi:hypothetical protein
MQPIVISDQPWFHGQTIQLSDSDGPDTPDSSSQDDGSQDEWRVRRGRNRFRIQSDDEQQRQPQPPPQRPPPPPQQQQPPPSYKGRRRFRVDSDQQEPPRHPLLASSSDDDEPIQPIAKRRRTPARPARPARPAVAAVADVVAEGAPGEGDGGAGMSAHDAEYSQTLERACRRVLDMAATATRLSVAEIRQMCHVCAALASGRGWSVEWTRDHRARINRELRCEFGDRPIAEMAKIPAILVRMVALYDRYFYRGLLCAVFGSNLTVCWDGRCSKIGGNCRTRPYELSGYIKIAHKVLLKVEEGGGAKFQSGGVACHSALEAAQLVFEHESVHAVIGAICHECGKSSGYRFDASVTPFSLPSWGGGCSEKGGHTRWFMTILNNLFGHNDYRHAMSHSSAHWQQHRRDKDRKQGAVRGMRPGDAVTFDNRGTLVTGTLVKVNRSRAFVSTPRGRVAVPFSLFKM